MRLYNSAALKEKLGELLDESEAIVAFAESEERELTTEEDASIQEIMAQVGEPAQGDEPATGIHADIAQAERYEKMRAMRSLPGSDGANSGNLIVPEEKTVAAVPRRWAGRLKAFTPANCGDDVRGEDVAYRAGQFFLATLGRPKAVEYCNQNGIQLLNQQTTTDPAKGGYLTPIELHNVIINIMQTYGASFRLAQVVPMMSDVKTTPKKAGGLTVQYNDEATDIPLSEMDFSQITQTAQTRKTLTKVSNELDEENIVQFMDALMAEIGEALGVNADREYIQGDGGAGSGGVTGLDNTAGIVATVTAAGNTWDSVTMADFTSLIGSLLDRYHPGASFLMSRQAHASTWVAVNAVAGGQNFVTLQDGSTRPAILGYPVEFSDQMPAEAATNTVAFFGNFSGGTQIGDRHDTRIATSEHAGFDSNSIHVRGTTRYDMQVHVTTGGEIVKLALGA